LRPCRMNLILTACRHTSSPILAFSFIYVLSAQVFVRLFLQIRRRQCVIQTSPSASLPVESRQARLKRAFTAGPCSRLRSTKKARPSR
jgi:hypothetical protein